MTIRIQKDGIGIRIAVILLLIVCAVIALTAGIATVIVLGAGIIIAIAAALKGHFLGNSPSRTSPRINRGTDTTKVRFRGR